MIRGVQDDRDLFFDRDLISHWLRHDAVQVTTDRLGYMDERERRAFERQLQSMERDRDRERDVGRGLGGRTPCGAGSTYLAASGPLPGGRAVPRPGGPHGRTD